MTVYITKLGVWARIWPKTFSKFNPNP